MNEVAILIPVLRRPHRVKPIIDSIRASLNGTAFQIVFIASYGDTKEIHTINRFMADDIRLLMIEPNLVGDYAKKINYAYQETSDARWFFLGADDIHFHAGWFNNAMAMYAATGRFVIGTQDLGNDRVLRGEHATHSLVHRDYISAHGTIDEQGKILHEGYPHEFVDDEFIATAKLRDDFVFCNDSVVEHLHPMWGKAPTDALYNLQRKRMTQGRRIFEKRKRLWQTTSR